ncbi:hypothetical protein BaRGS_00009271 [Batillaria attramentaria]|uniref:Uncharacterized protein n=1 Tax=Batillaria attramentaria TaxID=370345 RepID=A0ABD0LJC3_9CAEN
MCVRRRLQYTPGVRCKMPSPSGAKGIRWHDRKKRVRRRLQYVCSMRGKCLDPPVQKARDGMIQAEMCTQAFAVDRWLEVQNSQTTLCKRPEMV